MADDHTSGAPDADDIPVSQFADSLHDLVSTEALAAPSRPGVAGMLGRYEILRVLGRGGMGVVLLARDSSSAAPVALKTLRPEQATQPEAVRRFLAEARHMRQLRHPGIVPVLDIGEQDRVPWFAMPHFERGSLAAALAGGRPLDRTRILPIALAIAGALEHAHRHGIIHRDLKPANILLTADGGACVTDFGLARTVFNDAVQDPSRGGGEGTAPYMSPAVARGEAEDTRCDIYSFGAVLHEMLTGRAPYQGPDPAAVRAQILARPPPSVRSLNPKADERLAQVADGAMARELRDRYAHMADVVADLERIARGRPPLGAKAIRLGPALRRAVVNRRVLAAAATVFLLAAAGWAWAAGRPRITLERVIAPPQVTSWQGALVANWDRDGIPDFIIPETAGIKVVSGLGQVAPTTDFRLDEPHTSADITAHWTADANGDGYDDVFTCWANGANAVLAPLNQTGFALKRFCAPSTTYVDPQWGQDWTRLYARILQDLDGDGRRELIVSTGSYRGREPRALICFDYESQTQRWRQAIAPAIMNVTAPDLDGDGRREILVDTYAPCNGRILPDGTDDNHSYLYAFGANGQALWRVEAGGVFSEARAVLARKPGGGVAVYALAYSLGHLKQEGDREFGRLLLIDAAGHEKARWESRRGLLDCVATDLDGDGGLDLLATELSGRLLRFDAELRLRQEVPVLADRYDGVHMHIVGVTNLTRLDDSELVLTCWQSETPDKVLGNDRSRISSRFEHQVKLVVFSQALQPLAERTLTPRQNHLGASAVRLCDMDADGRPEIIFLSDALRVFKYRAGL